MERMPSRIIKSARFEDGSFAIRPAPVALNQDSAGSESLADGLAGIESGHSLAAQAKADALLAAAKAQADQLLAAAQAEADALLMQAELEAEQLRQAAQAEGQAEGRAIGLEEGRKGGHAEALTLHGQLLGSLADAIERFDAERQATLAGQQQELVTLAILIAQKILLMELSTSRQSVLMLAEASLSRLVDKTHVRLRVSPQDLGLVLSASEQLSQVLDHGAGLEVLADERVGVGGCLVETRTGSVDARINTQLAAVAAALLELPPGHESELDATVQQVIKALGSQDVAALLQPPAHPVSEPVRPVRPAPPPTLAAPPVPVEPARFAPPAPPASPAPAAAFNPAPAAFPPVAFTPIEPAPVVPAIVEPAAAPEPVEPAAVEPEPVAEVAPLEPPVPEPEPVVQAPVWATFDAPAPETPAEPPARPAPAAARPVDPSRRAAEGLAFRLGKLKKGKAVSTMAEEYDMSLLEGALTDEELEAIVKHVMPRAAATEIAPDQPLVAGPSIEDAAESLAARLGKKRRRLTEAEREAIGLALNDGTLDQILESIVPAAPAEPAAAAPAPSLDVAAERLAERMGQKVRKPAFKELVSEGPGDGSDPFAGVLADESIDRIMGSITPVAPAQAEAAEEPAPDLEKATDSLAKLLGKKRKNRPWYEGLEGGS